MCFFLRIHLIYDIFATLTTKTPPALDTLQKHNPTFGRVSRTTCSRRLLGVPAALAGDTTTPGWPPATLVLPTVSLPRSRIFKTCLIKIAVVFAEAIYLFGWRCFN